MASATAITTRASAPALGPCTAAASGTPGAARGSPRVIIHTTSASSTFITPAARIVPGSPTRAMRMKPLASTPTAAPKLLVK